MHKMKGQMLVELVMAIGIAAIILPAIITGLVTSREGKPQQQQRAQATALLKETVNAVRSIRDSDWTAFSTNGVFHPSIVSNKWTFASNAATSSGLTQQVTIGNVYRDSSGAITASGGTLDPSTKKADISISWSKPQIATLSATIYLTRITNLAITDTTSADFNKGVGSNIQITNTAGGEVKLANNNKAKWCSPAFSTDVNGSQITIDLPDGPPVAVSATASATTTAVPNDVFVATAPYATSSAKMAYVTVVANAATPSASLKGTFTLDATKYSAGTYPGSLGTLTNSFKTNDVKYFNAPSGNEYALLATDDPNHEVVVVQVKNGGGTTDAYQDSVNHIYKYWTFFNTKIYSSAATNDQSPYGYGASSVAILGTRGYVISGGFLYVFDLTNIDTATTTTSLPMLGCRIQLDGYDCQPGSPGQAAKYNAGSTGTNFATTSPIHDDCSDGGNIELHADNDIVPVKVGANTYVYVAVGGVTNPEFEIANVTTAPTSGTALTGSACGTSSGSSSWKLSGSLDFNGKSNTEEAANSVFANASGTRAYVSSNGGIDANSDGVPDSKQFYIINTSTPTNPTFLSGVPGSPNYGPLTGYYYGSGADAELYPRRSLTVLNGQRAVLVGKDGKTNSNDAKEYQVLNTETEATPTYCGGLNYDQGFNDLTAVSELDGDNYVYMVANTTVNELKIIEGGPDNALYITNGTFESQPIDASSTAAFNRFVADINQVTNTSVGIQVAAAQAGTNGCSNATYTYQGPGGTSNANDLYTASSSGTTSIANIIPLLSSGSYQNPGRCFKYKAYLSTSDQSQTPTFYDMIVNYSL